MAIVSHTAVPFDTEGTKQHRALLHAELG